MKKIKEKSPKIFKSSKEEKDLQETKKFSKLDIMQQIDGLKSLQHTAYLEGKTEKAMLYANQIIELAIRYDLSYYIKEQEDFLTSIAEKAQKKYFTSEIEKECLLLNEEYDKLVEAGAVLQAHELIETFKKKYENNTIFEKLGFVKALLEKENKTWIKHQSELHQK
jgi:hypothetical protein